MIHKTKDSRLTVNIHKIKITEDKVKENKYKVYRHKIMNINVKINNSKSTWYNSFVNHYILFYTSYSQKNSFN